MNRRLFLKDSTFASAGFFISSVLHTTSTDVFPDVRPAVSQRKFTSAAVEEIIKSFNHFTSNKELGWLFGNCFPNTLDTTVDFTIKNGKPDTYVITGDIDAMWLRDSTAQISPYLFLIKADPKLKELIAGVINRQTQNILYDPYANAFYKDHDRMSEWKDDLTAMKPGIHERKWEVDSLCYPIRLAYNYWKETGDQTPFNKDWREAILLIRSTFEAQQRKENKGPYKFERRTSWATDGVPLGGYGYPVKPIGLICSMFRPSDDATIYPFLIPSNFFAMVSLRQAAEMLNAIHNDHENAEKCIQMAKEINIALQHYAIVAHSQFGKVYAYEVNGFGSFNLMDDANVPSLLALPYLGAVSITDKVYQNTRSLILSSENPFFFHGKVAEGIGGPHAGLDMIWPISIIIRGLTSTDIKEMAFCLKMLQLSNAGTGFIHESFNKDDPNQFTRKWFAWANTLFGEYIVHLYKNHRNLVA